MVDMLKLLICCCVGDEWLECLILEWLGEDDEVLLLVDVVKIGVVWWCVCKC